MVRLHIKYGRVGSAHFCGGLEDGLAEGFRGRVCCVYVSFRAQACIIKTKQSVLTSLTYGLCAFLSSVPHLSQFDPLIYHPLQDVSMLEDTSSASMVRVSSGSSGAASVCLALAIFLASWL